MAILIFSKNSDNQENSLYRMAANQTVYDENKNWNDDAYDLVTISDEDYDALKKGTKFVMSKNGSTVNYSEPQEHLYERQNQLKVSVDDKILTLIKWLEANPIKPMSSDVRTYYNWLKDLDLSTVVTDPSADPDEGSMWDEETSWSDGTPLRQSIEAYGISQGINVFHLLELL